MHDDDGNDKCECSALMRFAATQLMSDHGHRPDDHAHDDNGDASPSSSSSSPQQTSGAALCCSSANRVLSLSADSALEMLMSCAHHRVAIPIDVNMMSTNTSTIITVTSEAQAKAQHDDNGDDCDWRLLTHAHASSSCHREWMQSQSHHDVDDDEHALVRVQYDVLGGCVHDDTAAFDVSAEALHLCDSAQCVADLFVQSVEIWASES